MFIFYFLIVVAVISLTLEGFFTVSAIDCGGQESATDGKLTFNSTLVANSTCTWTFPLANQSKVYMTWNLLSFNDGDSLRFYNGSESKDTLITMVAGVSENSVVYSSAKNTTVVFFTKNGIKKSEYFVVNYSTKECVLTSHHRHGSLTAPSYKISNGNLQCIYHLSRDIPNENYNIAVTFAKFDLKKGSLEVHDGGNISSPIIANYTDDTTDYSDLISTGPNMTLLVRFSTTKSQQGFMAAYTTVNAGCSFVEKIHKAENKTSPGFPGMYKNNMDCRWILTSDVGTTMRIEIFNFSVANDFDFITFIDGDAKDDHLIQKFSRSNSPEDKAVWMTSGNKLWIQFKSDEILVDTGIKFQVTPQEYGGLFLSEGELKFEVKNDSIAEDITFHLIVPDGKQALLIFNESHQVIPPAAEILCYEGFSTESNLVGRFWTDTPFHPVFASGNVMMIIATGFANNGSLSGSLLAHFQGIDKDGTMVNSLEQAGSYNLVADGNKLNSSTWNIYNHNGGLIALRLESLVIAENHRVVVYRGLSDFSYSIATFYNSTWDIPVIYLPDARVSYEVISGNHSVHVSETNDEKETLISASYKYVEECLKNVTAPAGRFSSPNYPNNYPYNAHCSWNISSINNKLMRIGFKTLELVSNHSVTVESVVTKTEKVGNQSYDVENTTELGVYQGNEVPDDIIYSGDRFLVTFSSEFDGNDNLSVGKGFLIEYEALDCGGNLTISGKQKSDLTINPAGYPKPPTKDMACVWIIEAPLNTDNTSESVNVINFKYELKNYANVSSSQLEIRDGGSVSSVEAPLNLPNGVKDLSLARGNKLWIRYTNKANDNGKPFTFQVSYNVYVCPEKDQCGNRICMHSSWKCNGIDDCGDGTDEQNCDYKNGSSGVPAWSIAVAVILTFFAAVAITLLAPALYKRVKYPNYSELRDLMTPVST